MSDESWVHAFSTQLDELRDFPEQAKINNVAHIAKTQERLAGPFVDCVINRLINISTPPTYRKPLFYAIDAIMKAAAPAYVPHFARQLAEKFPMTIRDISDVDRKKLTFMVGTWEERKFFVPELIAKMKNRLQVSATAAPAAAPRVSVNVCLFPLFVSPCLDIRCSLLSLYVGPRIQRTIYVRTSSTRNS